MLLQTPEQDSQSEKEVRKPLGVDEVLGSAQPESPTVSRFTVEYWKRRLFRPTHRKKGKRGKANEVQQLYVQVQYGGRRQKVGLGTNNAEEAGRLAARFYKNLVSKGWDAAWEALAPDRNLKFQNPETIGDYLDRVRRLMSVRPRTFGTYSYALRKIAREAIGLKDATKKRFDPKSLSWRKAADMIRLARLTPVKVTDWKLGVVAAAGSNPILIARARRNVNSFIRNARALFSRRLLKMLKERNVALPDPLPFKEVELEPQGNTKYRSTFKAKALLLEAKADLRENDLEAWIVFILGLGAGLRRKEIDALLWIFIDNEKNEIFVGSHEEFEVKSYDSEAIVTVDPFLISELKRFRGTIVSGYVLQNGTPGRPPGASQYYRANETFARVTKWLRKHDVDCDKPLHTLRKEFGSIICELGDVYDASGQLRHAQFSTTTEFYTENRRKTVVPIGALLSDAPSPTPDCDWVI